MDQLIFSIILVIMIVSAVIFIDRFTPKKGPV